MPRPDEAGEGLAKALVFPAQDHAREEGGGEREHGALMKEPQTACKQRVVVDVRSRSGRRRRDARRSPARRWTTNAANPTAQRRRKPQSSAPAAPSMGEA